MYQVLNYVEERPGLVILLLIMVIFLFIACPVCLHAGWMAYRDRLKQADLHKEREHRERIKAMELGLSPQPTGLNWPEAAVCIAIGAGVPIGSFVVAWLATLTAHAPDGIWVAPVFVSFAAIGASRKLAYRIIDPRSGIKRPAQVKSPSTGKPEFDPDAFDVVSSRG